MSSTRVPEAVKRIFTETFTARDIAEPLASFDDDAPSEQVAAFMRVRDLEVVGIRREGAVVGYVRRSTLDGATCGDKMTPLDEAKVLDDSESLLKTLTALEVEPLILIRALGTVCGIVTRADLQKAHARMWLFGIVTLIEMRFTELIEQHCPDDGWKQYVSEGRLQKAESLRAERQRANQSVRVLDCLQFADKGQIIARNEVLRAQTVFPSRGEAERTTKRLERLRNNLAHSQDIATSDWETIVSLCRFMAQPDRG